MQKLIDSHTHLQIKQFNKDRAEVIKRALDKNIWIVNVGDNKKASFDGVKIANEYQEGLYATIGQHPNEKEIFDYDFYRELAKNKKVVAIGECGLEYYRTDKWGDVKSEKKRQFELFLAQIELAKETELPLMIHCREAFADVIDVLKNHYIKFISNNPGIIHFFTGGLDEAKILADMGFSFTFGGLITFNREFDEVIKYLPIEKILLETDAPFVAPIPHRGQRNEPSYIGEVAKAIAQIKNLSFEQVAQETTKNAAKIFNL